ncbi:WD40-repeat-containing domain protein [Rhizoctonia solani]|nr:WD40-repeat-containing domain protein [Rhizoctonia solani]
MSSDSPTPDPARFRYCFTGIELRPSIIDPKCKISIKLFVDDELICNLPWLDNTQPPRWTRLLLCNVSPTSRVLLRLTRNIRGKHRSFDFPSYQISEADEGCGETTLEHPELIWMATVKSLSPTVSKRLFQDEFTLLSRINGAYDGLKPDETVKYLFKLALLFAGIAAEALSEGTAKLSFLIIVSTWELLEQQNQLDDTTQEILRGLVHLRDVVEVLGQASSATLAATMDDSEESINDILSLLEEVSVFIFNRLTITDSVNTSHDETPPCDEYDTKAYLHRLQELREIFHAAWAPASPSPADVTLEDTNEVEDEPAIWSWEDFQATLNESSTNMGDPCEILNLLKPLDPSGYNTAQACLNGTREAVLKRVLTWAQNRKNSESIMWISGQAGMGKTSVAASLCKHLDDIRALAGSVFCQRGDPNYSDPLRLINSLVHEFASRCPPYANNVASAIRSNRTLCTAHLDIRYEGLIQVPLKRLKSIPAPTPLVVVYDALDECGDYESRGTVLRMLYDMSQLVPWLKIIITARPESSLLECFRNDCPREPIVHLQTYDASDDIHIYVQAQLGTLSKKEQWPDTGIDQLCEMAQGVFLWASLATKYIKKCTIPALSRLKQVLENRKSPVTDHFDALYATALNSGMSDHNDDTRNAYTQCIGAILSTLEYIPIPIPDLQYLLVADGRIDEGTLERIVADLGPLLLTIDDRYVRFHHSSFKDYVANPARSHDFHVQFKQYDIDLTKACLAVMHRDLQFNICKLETSHLLNDEVPDLKRRIRSCIGTALKHACTHWIDYFIISPNQSLIESLRKFLDGPQFMYWVEVFSLLGRLDIVSSTLSTLESLKLADFNGWDSIALQVKDAQQFLISFYDVIAASTPHLYISALTFSPSGSVMAQKMRPHFPNTVKVARGADQNWHPCIKTIFHPYAVQSLSLSPDGTRVIPLIGHTDLVTCAVFSTSGSFAASGSHDTNIRVWDLTGGSKFPSQVLSGHSGEVNSVAFSPDGSVIVSASSDKTIRLWDLKAMCLIGEPFIGHSSRVSSLAFSPDGAKLVSGSWDKTVRVWSVDDSNPKLAEDPLLINGHSDAVTCVAFSPDGSTIVSGSVDKTLQTWNAKSGNKIAAHIFPAKHSDTITSVAFSRDGKLIASSSLDGAVELRRATTLTPFCQSFGHFNPVHSIVFSPDGSHVVSVWDITMYPPISLLAGHSSTINFISVSNDGSRILSGSSDNTVRMWDAQTGGQIGTFTGHSQSVNCVEISPDGTHILSGSQDRTLKLWDTTTYRNTYSYQHNSVVHRTRYSPDGTRIVLASDDCNLYLMDPTTLKMLGSALQGHSNSVNCLIYSHDGRYIASSSTDCTVILWDTKTASRTSQSFHGHTSPVQSVAISPCSAQLVSGADDGTVRVWDVKTGDAILTLTGHSKPVMAVAYSAYGTCVLSASSDNTVRVWDATTGQLFRQPIPGPWANPQFITFSPGADHVLFGCSDNAIRLRGLGLVSSTTNPTNHNITDLPGAFRWPANPHNLASHPYQPGWVTHDQKSLVFRLPSQYQQPPQLWDTQKQVPHPQTFLDYSKFVHGTAWTDVVRKA